MIHLLKLRTHRGFTLIELMTSISIFLIVMTISMGSILGIFDANRKSKSLKTVISNLNLTIESMSKEMRYGDNYHCGSSGTLAVAQNCPAGDTFMSFLSSDAVQTSYRLSGTAIEKQEDSGGFVAVTGPDVIIDQMTFYTLGAGTSNSLQPKVVLMLKGHAGTTAKGASSFTLQTLVSQRVLDSADAPYATPAYSYPTPIVYYNVTVTKAGAGAGTVSGPSISCGTGAGCTSSYAAGSSVTLTAAATAGSTFSAWSGACSGSSTCVLTVSAAKAVTATFVPAYATPYGYPTPIDYCYEQYGYGTGAGCTGDNICLYGGICSENSCWPAGYPRNNVNGCCSDTYEGQTPAGYVCS